MRAPTSSTSTPRPSSCSSSGWSVGDRDLTDLAWRPDEGSISANENNRFFDDLVDPLRRITANRRDGLEVAPLPEGPTALVLTASGLPVRLLSADLEDPVPARPRQQRASGRPAGLVRRPAAGRLGRRAHRPHRRPRWRRVPRCRAPSPASWPPPTPPTSSSTGWSRRPARSRARSRTYARRSGPPPAPTRPAPTS